MARRLTFASAVLCFVATTAAFSQSGSGQWFGSKAFRLTTGNGINSAVSLWLSPDDERAELRIMVVRQSDDLVEATGVWLKVGEASHLLPCSRVETSFFRTEGFRTCFTTFHGHRSATTIARCKVDWATSQRIIGGAPVELQVDTELKLLKRKRLSDRQLAALTDLQPIP